MLAQENWVFLITRVRRNMLPGKNGAIHYERIHNIPQSYFITSMPLKKSPVDTLSACTQMKERVLPMVAGIPTKW